MKDFLKKTRINRLNMLQSNYDRERIHSGQVYELILLVIYYVIYRFDIY